MALRNQSAADVVMGCPVIDESGIGILASFQKFTNYGSVP